MEMVNGKMRDVQTSKKMEWHRFTNVVDKLTKDNCFPWYMVPMKMRSFMVNPLNGEEISFEEDDLLRIRASDDLLPIGRPYNPSSYILNTHHNMWDFVEGIFNESGQTAEFESAGSFKNRARYYVSASMPEMSVIMNNDNPEYLYMNAFDGCLKDSTLIMGVSTIKPVCNNTVNMSTAQMLECAYNTGLVDIKDLRKARHFCSIRHTPNFNVELKKAKEIIRMTLLAYHTYAEQIRNLNKVSVTKEEARAIYAGFLFPLAESVSMVEDIPLISTKSLNLIDDLVYLFQDGKGNKGASRLDLYNGVTENYSSRPSLLNDGSEEGNIRLNRFVQSSQAGVFNRKKVEFFEMLSSNERVEKAFTDGNTVLSAQDQLRSLKKNEKEVEMEAEEVEMV